MWWQSPLALGLFARCSSHSSMVSNGPTLMGRSLVVLDCALVATPVVSACAPIPPTIVMPAARASVAAIRFDRFMFVPPGFSPVSPLWSDTNGEVPEMILLIST